MIHKPASCQGCPGAFWPHRGFVKSSPPTGPTNGVLIVGEFATDHDAVEGLPLVSKQGYYLFQQLKRVGIERDGFRIHNVLSCNPPSPKLAFQLDVINHCAPNLDATIALHVKESRAAGLTPVIVGLGPIALKRLLHLKDHDPLLKAETRCYPFFLADYGCWFISADAPFTLQKGNHHLVPLLQFAFQRALEIAKEGLTPYGHDYLLDPAAVDFERWASYYFDALAANPSETFLSYDIETPYKQGVEEDTLGKEDEDGDDYRILRVSFAYQPGRAVSVPWRPEYFPTIQRLFASSGPKVGWNNANYDDPRIIANGCPINGDRLDAMLCWHVLNSALPKSLGFVTPFYVKNTGVWKHLSDSQPAFYNAKDADMALHNFLGIRNDLKKYDQWSAIENHIVRLNRALHYMTGKGVGMDLEMRAEAEVKLTAQLETIEHKMEAAVPIDARKLKVYKKVPKVTDGLIQVSGESKIKVCPRCGVEAKADHFKSIGKKRLKKGDPENPCVGLKAEPRLIETMLWAEPQKFSVSKLGLTKYQEALKHKAIINRKEGKVTFDEKAILQLIKRHPQDPLYPRILEHRSTQKLLTTYVGVTTLDGRVRGGLPIGPDGRIHTLYTHNPSTLRLASQNPNLQNLPRPKGPDDPATIIRNLVVADPGHIFFARDYSGIEAVLVGYFAMARNYIRLAKMDVHSFYTAYALNELDGRIRGNDLPLLSWDDEKLRKRLSEIKKEFKNERNALYKHLVHGCNFKQGPKGAQEKIFLETGIEYPVKLVAKVMSVYFELFPEIPKWHTTILNQAENDGFVRNPFGYVHRFHKVFDYERIGGQWQKKPGPDTNKVIAFLPQSTAAGIIKEAILRLFFNRFDEAGQYLRLQVHDEIFSEAPTELWEAIDAIKKEEMERPVEALPLPLSYGMGPYLTIDTEGKAGQRWAQMH